MGGKERGDYDPAAYWEQRLRRRFDLTGVGHGSLGPRHNARLYRARERALDRALVAVGWSLHGCRVCDVGCGSGFYTEYCVRHEVERYTGLDITRISIESLQRRYPQLQFLLGDISSEDLRIPSTYDVVLAADVLFHIVDDRSFGMAISNIASSLRPGGLLIATDTLPPFTLQTEPHCRYRSVGTYERVFSDHALHVIHLEPIFALLQPPAYLPSGRALWRFYAWVWRYGWRIARLPAVDCAVSSALDLLDGAFFLRTFGKDAPNTKWLIAVKGNVA